jgi:uncharacterized iron-regulated protein
MLQLKLILMPQSRSGNNQERVTVLQKFRFANGPIDDENGPESLMNAWPLDENYIDYVEGKYSGTSTTSFISTY